MHRREGCHQTIVEGKKSNIPRIRTKPIYSSIHFTALIISVTVNVSNAARADLQMCHVMRYARLDSKYHVIGVELYLE